MLEEFKPGESLTYVRNEKYHFGAPVVERMFLPIIKDDVAGASALKAGQIDWKYSFTQQGYDIVKDDPNLQFAEYPDFGYYALYFNLHPSSNSAGGYVPLFSTMPEIRQAIAQCFNKPETVEAATNGAGVPVYSDVPPASWAYNPDLPKYEYDPDAANALLDSINVVDSNGDGVRELPAPDGRELSTKVYVRAGRPDRIAYMTLLAEQVKECGIDIQTTEGDFTNVLLKILDWPHIPPGDDHPYDGYFGGFSSSLDPDPFSIYHSSECTTSEKISTFNYICWQNDEVDQLIEAGLEELDQDARAQIYQQLGAITATELPAIYAWADIAHEGLSATFQTEGLDLGSPLFYWEIHKLSNPKSST
jgi:peptide/nickel transport system substrate-binding protein